MQRKNIPLIVAVTIATALFMWPVWRALLPAWPGYRVKEYIRVNSPLVALTHVRIIDGSGAPPIENCTVVLSNGKIQSIGSALTTPVPQGAQTLDLVGYTIIPGLVGMHDHMFYGGIKDLSGFSVREMGFSFPRLYLASGVTSIRTAGALDLSADLRLKDQIDEGWVAGPKMHVTGPYMNGDSTPEETRNLVERWADKGATSFKAYMYITRAELATAIRTAHERDLKVTGHLCSVGFREAVALGIDNLEHGIIEDAEFVPGKTPDVCPPRHSIDEIVAQLDIESAPVQQMIRDLIEHHVAITSTLPVFESFVPFRTPPNEARVFQSLSTASRADYVAIRRQVNEEADRSHWTVLLKKEMQFELNFVRSGGLLLAGEDPTGNGGNLAGFGDQRELELLVEAGFTPLEAIHIATANGAAFLGESDRIGSLAPGKQADLVVIKGDPSSNIADIEKVEIVFKNGVGYDSTKLIESVRGSVRLD